MKKFTGMIQGHDDHYHAPEYVDGRNALASGEIHVE
jgi:hypothetical protein